MPAVSSSPTARVAALLLALYGAGVFVALSLHPDGFQWDLRSYCAAGRALAAGEDPYGVDWGRASSPTRAFVYMPATLPLWRPFGELGETAAYYAFLYSKLIALALLIWLWRTRFVRGDADVLFYVLCALGFSGTVYSDVAAGNISIFEQLVLWLGLAALLRGRLLAFSALIVVVASFKVTLLLLLALVWLARAPLRVRCAHFAGALAAFALVHGIAYAAAPEYTRSFLHRVSFLNEVGPTNPSTWAAIQDIFSPAPMAVQWAIYAFTCLLVLVPSCLAVRKLRGAGDLVAAVYVACFAYALVVPRLKSYSYVLLIVPAFWVIKRFAGASAYPLLALAIAFTPNAPDMPGFGAFMRDVVYPYYSLLLAYALWAMALTWVWRQPSPSGGGDRCTAPAT